MRDRNSDNDDRVQGKKLFKSQNHNFSHPHRHNALAARAKADNANKRPPHKDPMELELVGPERREEIVDRLDTMKNVLQAGRILKEDPILGKDTFSKSK